MICIYCLSQKTRVLNSRAHRKNPLVWRRRTCTSCGKIFTSYERPSCDDLLIENSHGESNRFILRRFDEAIAMQYAIQQGYISSIKRQRGRPSIQKNDNY